MFKELDIVMVIHDIDDKIKNGMIGTIVYSELGCDTCEVEFVDTQGYTIALLTLNKADLMLVKNY